MKLYVVVGSGNCRKVQATINHLGLEADLEYLDFFEGDLGKPGFLAINPNGRVPALVEGDFKLWESNAIMQYLADKVPGNSLFPTQPQTRADIVRWQCWELAHFNNVFAMTAFQTVLKAELLQQPPNQPVVDYALEGLAEFTQILEDHLQGRDYVVGDSLTLADYSVVNIEGFKEAIPFDWSPYPNVNAYFDRMRADPHWAATAPESPEALGRKPATA
jgi:glutathione S-transferase